jgi:hypothetical protein
MICLVIGFWRGCSLAIMISCLCAQIDSTLDFVCFSRIFTFYFYWFDGFMILKKEEMLPNSSGNMSSLGSSGAFASLGILLDGLLGNWFLEVVPWPL